MYKDSNFYSSFKQFWVAEYSNPILAKINSKANEKPISTFGLFKLFTKIPD